MRKALQQLKERQVQLAEITRGKAKANETIVQLLDLRVQEEELR